MKKLLLLIGMLVVTTSVVLAKPVDSQRAQYVGQRFLSSTVLGEQRADVQLQLVYAPATRGEVDYYVFNVQDGAGFVVVAGDDCVKPVLAYSTSGQFAPNAISEGFAYMLSVYRSEIDYVREHHFMASSDIVAEWKSVETSGNLREGRQARSVVGPLCQTLWNQCYPWNNQCPQDPEGDGGYVYAGCVATATAQVMKYHEYPARGVGSYSYNPEGYATQTANFGETDYHFELMPLTLDSTSTDEEVFYIAQLLHHVGVSVDMQYSGNGSGAYSESVPTALRNHFGYTCDNGITDYSMWGWSEYTHDQWVAMLKDAGLNEGIPLYYSGSDMGGAGGHAFVCDGYDENDYFHFNWGWSGRDDAWCAFGALNTTKYSFDLMNSFIGHILPESANYYQKADSVSEMNVLEKGSLSGVMLHWRNPSTDLNGNPLSDIESVTVRRNFEVIATLTDAQPGAEMSFEDDGLDPGLYEYSVFVTNASGISRTVYRDVMVGEKCEVIFDLHDQGGDGWKGACISVTDEQGKRIAVVGMSEGSEATVVVPLLRQNINFIWNHGWFHTQEQYDTDAQCSFTIRDSEGNEIFVSSDLEDGPFLVYDNNCEQGALTCHPVENLAGEYQWHNGEEFGALLTWNAPLYKANLRYFQVYRTAGADKDDELIAEIPFNGANSYSYFDNAFDILQDDVHYSVNSVYALGDEQCESEFRDVMVTITDVEENTSREVTLYPNPTSGMITVSGTGVMRVVVSNLLGQKIGQFVLQDSGVINLDYCESGVYLVRIETENGVVLQKVSINH